MVLKLLFSQHPAPCLPHSSCLTNSYWMGCMKNIIRNKHQELNLYEWWAVYPSTTILKLYCDDQACFMGLSGELFRGLAETWLVKSRFFFLLTIFFEQPINWYIKGKGLCASVPGYLRLGAFYWTEVHYFQFGGLGSPRSRATFSKGLPAVS